MLFRSPLRTQYIDDDLKDMFYLLGENYEVLNDKKNAVKYYQKVYGVDKNYEGVFEALTRLGVTAQEVASTELEGLTFVALDFETANRTRGSACAIGMCKMLNGKVTDTYYQVLRPVPYDIDPSVMKYHHVTKDEIENAPTIGELWSEIEAFIADNVIVVHNISFDKPVLIDSLENCDIGVPNVTFMCSLKMAKTELKEEKGDLKTLCKKYKIPLNHHNALSDACAAATLMLVIAVNGNSNFKHLRKKYEISAW